MKKTSFLFLSSLFFCINIQAMQSNVVNKELPHDLTLYSILNKTIEFYKKKNEELKKRYDHVKNKFGESCANEILRAEWLKQVPSDKINFLSSWYFVTQLSDKQGRIYQAYINLDQHSELYFYLKFKKVPKIPIFMYDNLYEKKTKILITPVRLKKEVVESLIINYLNLYRLNCHGMLV